MAVIIGVDPHKGSHTAVAIDGSEENSSAKKSEPARHRSSNWCRGPNRSGRGSGRCG